MAKVRELPEEQKQILYAAVTGYRSWRLPSYTRDSRLLASDIQDKILAGEPLDSPELAVLAEILGAAFERTTDMRKAAIIKTLLAVKFSE
jgi:hypothetical protein